MIVGGGKRGVVATACYVARTFGISSAMPMFEALRLCPQAKVIRPNMEKYAKAGREVRQMMLALTPLVEPLSIDEAFLDLTGTERLHGMPPAKALARFATDVEQKLGITRLDRAFLQQIPRQDRLRPRQAARLCRAGRKRSAGVPGAEAGRLHLSASARPAPPGSRATAFTGSPICRRPSEIDLMRRYGEEGRATVRAWPAASTRAASAPSAKPRACPRKRRSSAISPTSARSSGFSGTLTEEVSARLKAQGTRRLDRDA